MYKSTLSRKIAEKFSDKINDENVIYEVFDYLGFDCSTRCYVDPCALDEKIKSFIDEPSVFALESVIEMIQKGKEASAMDEKSLLGEIKGYISRHAAEQISLEQVATRFHISYYYLSHLFKEGTGQTFNQFRTAKRLEKAIRILLETNEKISTIATDSGFGSISYFSEMFIKYTGKTPSEFSLRICF